MRVGGESVDRRDAALAHLSAPFAWVPSAALARLGSAGTLAARRISTIAGTTPSSSSRPVAFAGRRHRSIARRRPGNPIGWLFCVVGVVLAVAVFATAYGHHALVAEPRLPSRRRVRGIRRRQHLGRGLLRGGADPAAVPDGKASLAPLAASRVAPGRRSPRASASAFSRRRRSRSRSSTSRTRSASRERPRCSGTPQWPAGSFFSRASRSPRRRSSCASGAREPSSVSSSSGWRARRVLRRRLLGRRASSEDTGSAVFEELVLARWRSLRSPRSRSPPASRSSGTASTRST